LFIQDRMDEGLTQQEIAQRLGKSKGYISRAASLTDAPAVVIEALQAGKLGGVTEAYELSKLHAEHPQEVAQLVARQQEIPRAVILALRDRLEAQAAQPDAIPAVGQTANTELFAPAPAAVGKTLDAPARPKEAPAPAAGQTAKPVPAMPVVMAEYKGQPLVLDFSARPAADGHFFGRRPGSPRRLTVPAAQVRLVGFAAG
jgi:ParB family chromosome partitioning protein